MDVVCVSGYWFVLFAPFGMDFDVRTTTPSQIHLLSTTPPKKESLFPLWAVIKSVNRGRPVVLPEGGVRPEIAGEICVPRPGTIQLRSPLPGLHPRLDRAKEEAESFLSMSRCTAASRSTKGMGKQRAKIK